MNHSCLMLGNPTARQRRGISLLEIMISIGIVGIGLIGVASLIPLAHFKATEGVQEERKALFGKRAYREFFVQGFDRPGWYNRGTGTDTGTPFWVWRTALGFYEGVYDRVTQQVVPRTYCFDPHWVAARLSVQPPLGSVEFPDVGPKSFQIPRITLMKYRPEFLRESLILHGASPIVASTTQAAFVGAPGPTPVWSFGRADEVFRLRDDIVVEPPENPNDIARQSYLSEPTGLMKRLSGGSYSWMATLVPELASSFSPASPSLAVPYMANRYRMSIVVFNQRNLLSEFAEEVLAEVAPPPNSLITGTAKEIVITEIGTNPPIAENVGVRHIRPGDWIALIQQLPMPSQYPFTQLQWYQVASTDEQTSDTTMIRHLSLSGPDWNPIWDSNLPIYAVYLRNVETVYEKTIELQQ